MPAHMHTHTHARTHTHTCMHACTHARTHAHAHTHTHTHTHTHIWPWINWRGGKNTCEKFVLFLHLKSPVSLKEFKEKQSPAGADLVWPFFQQSSTVCAAASVTLRYLFLSGFSVSGGSKVCWDSQVCSSTVYRAVWHLSNEEEAVQEPKCPHWTSHVDKATFSEMPGNNNNNNYNILY